MSFTRIKRIKNAFKSILILKCPGKIFLLENVPSKVKMPNVIENEDRKKYLWTSGMYHSTGQIFPLAILPALGHSASKITHTLPHTKVNSERP
jgi:hypothetical protein